MTPDLERYLWERIGEGGEDHRPPRPIIDQMVEGGMIQSPKQAWATLEKWERKGLYNYGVSLDLGWKETPHDEVAPL